MSESERLRVFRKMIYRRVKDAIFTLLDKRETGGDETGDGGE